MSDTERAWTAIAVLILMTAAGFIAWYITPGWNWLLVMALLFILIAVLGKAVTGRSLGILINERKLMSLSRFQMILWTVLIISAWLVIAMERVRNGAIAEPLAIGVDWQVWALLGISTTSLVGTPLLNGSKKRKEPGRTETDTDKDKEVTKAAIALNEPMDDIKKNRVGVLYANNAPKDARFTDLFEGDELANAAFLDVGKLQLFFFTVIIAMTYSVQLFQLIAYNDLTDDVSLPTINQGLLALLGVSHAGYLGTKGISHTPSSN